VAVIAMAVPAACGGAGAESEVELQVATPRAKLVMAYDS